MNPSRRRPLGVAVALAVATCVTAWSDSATALDKAACVSAADNGQKLRKEHKLLAAREFFIQCARPECPALVSQDCVQWLGEAERRVASVLVKARDERGKPLTEVRLSVDGAVLSDRPTAAPIEVDPGRHVFRYESAGYNAVEERLELAEGERGRVLAVEFHEGTGGTALSPVTQPPPDTGDHGDRTGHAEKPASPSSGSGFKVAALVFGGLGVVGLGTFAGLALSAQSDQDALKGPGGCAPYCKPSDVDPISTKFTAANVSLGVGLGAIGVAAVLLIIGLSQHEEPAKAGFVLPTDGLRF